ncbi:MAG: DUF4159 domain-containing protein [Lentisphaeraceae bacterium]|nr:DUF4159 domain-containing protein [Lentisphaeraceae bacterium]
MSRLIFITLIFLSVFTLSAGELNSSEVRDKTKIRCGNLVYAGTRSAVCFANKFLSRVSTETQINVAKSFKDVKLNSKELFDTPFCVFSGGGNFSLSKAERDNLKKYLLNGGFILASPNCSNEKWDSSLRRIMKSIFPKNSFKKVPMDHPIFSLVYQVKALHLKNGGTAGVEGLFIGDRLVMVYSKEGLNDVGNAKGCCCCGGNEIKESQKMNVNILTYSLLH